MDISIDQLQVFLAIAEEGSFSAAARSLSRGQSVVTYAIQKLEAQVGKSLFDRTQYRPTLTESGYALLPHARKICQEIGAFGLQMRGIDGGVETQLNLAVDAMFPMPVLLKSLKLFQAQFPAVQAHIHLESTERAVKLVLDAVCQVGLVITTFTNRATMARTPLTEVELVTVVAPDHPLAQVKETVSTTMQHDHVRLVLTDRPDITDTRDHGMQAARTWRLADIGIKHAMLKDGLGFGSMPLHMVAADLEDGSLVRIALEAWDGAKRTPALPVCAISRIDPPIGPAAQWLIGQLEENAGRASG